MRSDWTKHKLSHIIDIIGGGTPKTSKEEYWNGSIPWLSVVDFNNSNRFVEKTEKSISEVGLKNSSTNILNQGDIIISARGTVGALAQLLNPMAFNQSCYGIRGLEDHIKNDFLYYLLINTVNNLKRIAHGGVFDTITRKTFESIEVNVPPIDKQEGIASVLGLFDQKIQLNQQINETLEAIAQAIFKSWFVDFDPVRAKLRANEEGYDPERAAMAAIAGVSLEKDWRNIDDDLEQKLANMTEAQRDELKHTASLFPDEMVDSELGEIPKGWEVIRLEKVIEIHDAKRVPLSRREREKRPGSYPYYGATSIMDYIDDFIFDGIHVLMAEDGSVMDDNGKPVLQYVEGKIWVNNHAHVLNGKSSVSDELLYLFLQTVDVKPYLTGAVQLKINQRNLKSIPFLHAGEEVFKVFSVKIGPLFTFILQNEEENESLEDLRDTLLAKLISGELDVSEAAPSFTEAR
ncbi:MAG TPA: restriction endonuclease subunit S [Fodinibius sp.]|nr:restriction endonuclease subunit S [Fodinibius sp.]